MNGIHRNAVKQMTTVLKLNENKDSFMVQR